MKSKNPLLPLTAIFCGITASAFAVNLPPDVSLSGGTDSNNYTVTSVNAGVNGWGTFNGTFDVANQFLISPNTTSGPLTFNGAISGVSGIQIQPTSSNPVIFNGNNSYQGDTNLNGAWLRLGSATALGTTAGGTNMVPWGGGASYLDVNGQTIVGESLTNYVVNSQLLNSSASTATWAGAVNLAAQTRFSAAGAGNLVVSGNIAGTETAQVDASGGGQVVFSGNNTNSGWVVVANTRLVAGSAQAFGTTAGPTAIAGWASWGQVDVNGQNIAGETFQNDLTNGVLGNFAATNATWGGSVVGNAQLRIITGSTGNLDITGNISGSSIQVDSTGGGVLGLSGNNTFTGDMNIANAYVKLGSATALGTTAGVTAMQSWLGGWSNIDINGQGIVGETLINNVVNGHLFNSSASNASWSGSIVANQQVLLATSGAGSMELSGTISGASGMQIQPSNGAVILSGNNSFAGNVNINGATVRLGHANALGDTTGQTYMVDWNGVGSNLDLNGFTVTGETLTNGFTNSRLSNSAATGATWAGNVVANAQLAMSSGAGGLTVSGAISGASSIQVDGGVVTLSGNNTYGGATVIANSRVFIGNANALGTTAGQTYIAGWAAWGALDLNGFTVAGETLNFDAGGNLENSAAGAAAWNGNVNNNVWMVVRPTGGTLTVGGNITGAGGVSKTEASTAIFSGTNTYQGATNIDQGTLEIATGGSITSPANVNIASPGTLKFSGGSVSINSGAGYIINNGGTVDVNGQTIAAGSYEAAQMNANAKLVNSSTNAATILGWTGTANKNTVWINAAGVGIETVGDLDIQSIVTDGNTDNGFTKTGAGTLTLSNLGNDLGSGAVAVSAGTLYLSGNLGAGSVNVGSAGTIGGDGSITGSLAFFAGADFLFNPTTTLTVNGGTVSFGGFGVADLAGLTNAVAEGTYTLINGTATFNFANVSNFGLANAYDLGGGKSAYFESGSMNLVVIPEPRAALLGGLGLLALLRRRRA
jgi:autotransporter-associated beta strand protein